MGFARAQGASAVGGFGSASGVGHGFSPGQGAEVSFSPDDIQGLALWLDGALGVTINGAAYFYGPNSQYLSRTSFVTSPVTKFTACGWTTDLLQDGSYPGIFGIVGSGGDVFVIQQQASTNKVFCTIGGGSNFILTDADAGLTSGLHHLAVVYDGSLSAGNRAKIYIDGSLVASSINGTIPASVTSTTPDLKIGTTGTFYLTGFLEKWEYFTEPLDATAIASLYNAGVPIPYASMSAGQKTSMRSHYELGTSAGVSLVDSHGGLTLTNNNTVGSGLYLKTWADQSGGSRNATQSGPLSHEPVYDTSAINGRPAPIFDGLASQVTVPDDATLSPTTGLTLCLVAAIGTLPSTEVALVSKRNDQVSQSWALTLDKASGKMRFHVATASTTTAYGEATIPPDNSVRLIRVVYDGSLTGNANRLKIFVGGVQETLSFSGTIPATMPDSTEGVIIGAQKTSNALDLFAPFRAAEVVIYPSAVSSGNGTLLDRYFSAKYGSLVIA